MKTTQITLLLVGISMCATAQTPAPGSSEPNDVKKEKLRGQVQNIVVSGFTVERKDGKLKKGRPIHTAASQYNDKGNLLEFVSSSGEDTVQGEYVHFKAVTNRYKYDNNGVLIGNNRYDASGALQDSVFYKVDERGNRIDWYSYKGDGTMEWNYNRKYDKSGNLLETSEYHMGKLMKGHAYKYDDKSNVTEETWFDGDRMTLKELYKYDNKRNVTEVADYNQAGELQSRYTYKYDGKGNQVEERAYDAGKAGKFKKLATKYDKDDNPIEVTQYAENGKVVYECKMDAQGNHTLDATYDENGKLIEKVTQSFKYDDKGNEVENIRYAANGEPEIKNKYIYTYDNEKNWFIKICYENEKPVRITERNITYAESVLTKK